MKLIECYIENFGKICKQKFNFTDGLNCIIEDNGSGKTTLAVFIKVMLYGMSDTKRAALDENDRKHYLPWGGGACGGSLTFSAGGKTYRVERSFAPKASDDNYTLYDTLTGRISTDFPEGLGEGLFGIDADGFERTVFLSERALTPKSENKSISAKLSDLVGCDGDIGGMDEALKALEEKRKFYYKKGGSGEIADTKAKIDTINRRLDALRETERAAAESRTRLAELAKQMEAARGDARALMKRREEATLRAAEMGYEKQYKEIKAIIEQSEKQRDAVAEIFGERIPTHSEIDEASYKSVEAKNLEAATSGNKNDELLLLGTRFATVDQSKIENARGAIERLKSESIDESDPDVKMARRIFAKRVPTVDEIDEMERFINEKKGRSPIGAILFILVATACLVGIFTQILNPIAGAVGIIASAIVFGIWLSKAGRDKRNKINDFFSSVSGVSVDGKDEMLTRLADMRRLMPVVTGGISAEESERLHVLIKDLCLLYPGMSAEQIIRDYDRYTELMAAEKYLIIERGQRSERAKQLKAEVNAFIGRFKLKTNDPFGELRTALNEYIRLCGEINAKRADMARLQSLHSIGEGDQRRAEAELEEIDRLRKENDELVAGLSRDYALTERAYANQSEELESREELILRKSELEEKLACDTENYETVLLTKKYLAAASDNMTAKYLGKTKAGFIKYAEKIGGISGERFEMDTDFSVTKQEGMTTKPTDAYSRGTKDMFNLAARLALVDSLYEKESPFIILDDPFTAFDDKRTWAAIKALKEISRDRQIIYFTCSKSRSI
ncbi:MAG: AAA family ATPase [Clostridia bacterium]|nr:AAA family ATPase [Clostridia bacterium]